MHDSHAKEVTNGEESQSKGILNFFVEVVFHMKIDLQLSPDMQL